MTRLDEVGLVARRLGDASLAALSVSAGASLLRQSGRHGDALTRDGRALALVDPRPDVHDHAAVAAVADVMVNLAADNLGLGRFGASERLLNRADRVLAPHDETVGEEWVTGRPRVRLFWVRAERALYTGDPATALIEARRALALVRRFGAAAPPRHRIKTELIVAAAVSASGDTDPAIRTARRLRAEAAAGDLIPLEWAALSLLAGIGDDDAYVRTDMDDRYRLLYARGMPFVTVTNDR
ncbi:hypothetical protein ABLE92_01055 [Gordonia sp. VNQ95]|uniref:hypothetical protein n=1 Tax=Gordonia sp. VNQ95 TaxID=3156619 RepID=UPI0032B58519